MQTILLHETRHGMPYLFDTATCCALHKPLAACLGRTTDPRTE